MEVLSTIITAKITNTRKFSEIFFTRSERVKLQKDLFLPELKYRELGNPYGGK